MLCCNAMHDKPPYLECELEHGHPGNHKAMLGEDDIPVEWDRGHCVHPRVADRMRATFDASLETLRRAP